MGTHTKKPTVGRAAVLRAVERWRVSHAPADVLARALRKKYLAFACKRGAAAENDELCGDPKCARCGASLPDLVENIRATLPIGRLTGAKLASCGLHSAISQQLDATRDLYEPYFSAQGVSLRAVFQLPRKRKPAEHETLLWHGTSVGNIPAIVKEGFQLRNVAHARRFGDGAYFTDVLPFALQYTDWRLVDGRAIYLVLLVAVDVTDAHTYSDYDAGEYSRCTGNSPSPLLAQLLQRRRQEGRSVEEGRHAVVLVQGRHRLTQQIQTPNAERLAIGGVQRTESTFDWTPEVNQYVVFQPERCRPAYIAAFELRQETTDALPSYMR
eukprot:TRINITY_DN9934_c0_g1_i1.p1 TRINITY_DN9934_c0_g1~~TRINITY_DN9934_c0_g1_i1.p1  ORF type:complete len:333 (-),score=56.27 TRINITY_DN9934_c0_g1_i1:27-1004(-)